MLALMPKDSLKKQQTNIIKYLPFLCSVFVSHFVLTLLNLIFWQPLNITIAVDLTIVILHALATNCNIDHR